MQGVVNGNCSNEDILRKESIAVCHVRPRAAGICRLEEIERIGADIQVVCIGRIKNQGPDRNVQRNSTIHRLPARTSVISFVDTVIRSREQQIVVSRIYAERSDKIVYPDSVGKRPRRTSIYGLKHAGSIRTRVDYRWIVCGCNRSNRIRRLECGYLVPARTLTA